MSKQLLFDPGEGHDQDLALAEEFLRSLLRKRKLMARPKLAVWALEFKRLRQTHGDQGEVLRWYFDHVGERGLPQAYSGRTLRLKFQEVLDAYCKQNRPASELATQIQKEMGLYWPAEEKGQELQFLQLSIDNYEELVTRIIDAKSKVKPRQRRGKFVVSSPSGADADYRLLCAIAPMLGPTKSFVMNWTTEIHRMAWEWSEWSGHLLGHAFRFTSPRFQKTLNTWAADVSHPHRTKRIAELLNYED